MGTGAGTRRRTGGKAGVINIPGTTPVRGGGNGGAGGGGGGAGEGGGGGNGPRRKRRCWEFWLVHPTAAARDAEKGLTVWGEIRDSKVRVISARGELGDATKQMGQDIIKAVAEKGGTPSGKITEKKTEDAHVRLCLG